MDLPIMFKDGGFFMWVILLTAMLHMVVLAIQAILRKKIDLMPVLWSLCAAILMFGLLGKLMGIVQSEVAVVHAADEMKQTLLAAGISVQMYTGALSIMLAVPMAIASGVMAAFVQPKQGESGPQPTGGS